MELVNYMLTRMINDGVSYDAILKEAQDLGYAEAHPTFNVGGFNALINYLFSFYCLWNRCKT